MNDNLGLFFLEKEHNPFHVTLISLFCPHSPAELCHLRPLYLESHHHTLSKGIISSYGAKAARSSAGTQRSIFPSLHFTLFYETSLIMLLLLLFMTCLASTAAQTTVFPPPRFSTETSAMTASSGQTTAVLPSANPHLNVMAILQTAVSSNLKLNKTTVAPVLSKLHEIIRDLQPNITFSLSLKCIDKVCD